MKRQIIQLTEEQLHSLIKDCVEKALNEMDGATYSRMYNASHRAMNDMQNGNSTRTIGNKTTDNDDIITRASSMEPTVQQHWLRDYVGKTFKFFGEDRMGLVAHLLFTLEKVTKLDVNKTILVGTIVFNNKQINGDGIIIDFAKNRVQYHERGSRHFYNLEIDNRVAPMWNSLINQLKYALNSRKQL